MIRYIFVSIFILLFASCDNSIETIDNAEEEAENTQNNAPNILLIIADDMGLDAAPGYDIGSTKPNMPNLQNLINSGIKFTNLWSNPTCSPTRATILTGKYGFKTGVLEASDILSTSETSLQSYMDTNSSTSYNHAVIGKWHLSNNENHPNNMGINHFAGLIGGGVQSYWNWNLTINGVTTKSTEYTTTKFTDLAINWVAEQTTPWFLWLAYNAPHTPFHLPPNDLHFQGTLPSDQVSIDSNPLPYYMAALEALDTEMGRLINSMSSEEKDNTVIIFIGDNGTPNQVVQEHPSTRAKGSVYQGGVNVPMIVSGKNVTRINETEDALINTTDFFTTIANIAGTSDTEIHDSKSFKNLLVSSDNTGKRDYIYTENEDFTIRNATHKYIYFNNGSEALFNLNVNPLESPNLLNANQLPLSNSDTTIKLELTTKLSEIRN
ncbi:sulfatase-like hydrolase/transferase [Flavivirga spongiicola]|uniref:Sulfatase-like hydrolase/transferase n=1 Tax=Flavivirga spongiicola TaxID=421621 RepID=A0ABU7Y070_9FLAO|nr:sulfatase-like hydrolase/transferase [Flavivirga sp. MEBiC05379]MDO5980626.1 sulfatase-like hydrolase/transferase [Flavivirga sp. MEBiC05379]